MTSAGEVLKRFRRARNLTLGDLSELTRQRGPRVSTSQIGKVERGERKLTDSVFSALAAAMELTEAERQQVQAARAGTGAVDVVSAVADLEAKMISELALLRGELRASLNAVMDALDRLRDQLRP
jgi:transcriptional regulator with XRE-family HTH domain